MAKQSAKVDDKARQAAVDDIVDGIEGLDARQFHSSAELTKATKQIVDSAFKRHAGAGSRSKLTSQQRARVAAAEANFRTDLANLPFDPDNKFLNAEQAARAMQAGTRMAPAKDEDVAKYIDPTKERPDPVKKEREVLHGRTRAFQDGVREQARQNAMANGGGGPGIAGQPHQKLSAKELRALRVRTLKDQWKVKENTAQKLVKAGFDPLNPPKSVDAAELRIQGATVARLVEHGVDVKNAPGTATRKTGLTTSELVKGREASAGSALAGARAQQRRGIFRRKTVYQEDSQGNVTPTDVGPRVTAGGAAKAAKEQTVGAIGRSLKAKADARERRRLRNPFNRINRIEEVERNRRLVQLEGEIGDASGFRRSRLLLQLKIYKLALIHKGWVTFILLASILFVPWIGVWEWSGWALAALVTTLIKFGALVLVNVYNLMASSIVSLINLIGNSVSGLLEAATRNLLDWLKLSPVTCNAAGECGDRVFSYTISKVDTTFPIIPEIGKPDSFDSRTLIEVLLGLAGIKFDIFNQIRRWLAGA